MAFVSVVIAVIGAVLLLPTASDLVSLIRTARRRSHAHRRQARPDGPLPQLLFLVPAHDEELLIADCVKSLRAMRYPATRFDVVVIADNCADGTAQRARDAGATILERHDLALRGKPRAIAWALGQLSPQSYDAVVIIDADTVVDPGFAEALGQAAPLREKAVQAYFDVANPKDSAITRMAEVLASANYHFAYPLKRRAGVNAPLLGNGMSIGTQVLATIGWKAFSITEDWELYAQFTAAGVRIHSLEEAHLYSQEARSLSQSVTQRQRWTAGKITVLWRYAGALLRSRHIGWAQKLDAVGELSAPGPAVHLGIVLVLSAGALLLGLPASRALLVMLWAPMARTGVYGLAALARRPDPIRSALAFAFLPLYVIWRLGAVAASVKMLGDKPWIRTARH